ncbi:MAG TPA: hypothetical protein PKO06_21105, partial [Candidatus Ozemobacteraceae bacterium]|nr:hypothetical protein [Candidatus Ozemobacteraceae bacterium]
SDSEDIRFIQPLGFDSAQNLILLYDTARERVLQRIRPDGTQEKNARFPLFDPGIELTTPWWLNPDGTISWVEMTPRQATIRRISIP